MFGQVAAQAREHVFAAVLEILGEFTVAFGGLALDGEGVGVELLDGSHGRRQHGPSCHCA
jgi:hypothetical protein